MPPLLTPPPPLLTPPPPPCLATALTKGKPSKAELVLALSLLEESLADPEDKPDEVSYSTMLAACVRQGLWPQADSILAAMQQQGIPAPEQVYTMLFEHYYTAQRDANRAVEAFETMQLSGITPSLVTCKALLQVLAASSKPGLAWYLLQEMQREGRELAPSQQVYETVMLTLLKAGQLGRCWHVHQAMLAQGVGLARPLADALITACTQWLLERGQLPEGLAAQEVAALQQAAAQQQEEPQEVAALQQAAAEQQEEPQEVAASDHDEAAADKAGAAADKADAAADEAGASSEQQADLGRPGSEVLEAAEACESSAADVQQQEQQHVASGSALPHSSEELQQQ
jgi:pentatricopeptide repeat protein